MFLGLVHSADRQDFSLTAPTVMTVLILLCCGAVGCSTAIVQWRANQAPGVEELSNQTADGKSPPERLEPAAEPVLNISPPVLLEPQIIQEETLPSPSSKVSIEGAAKAPARISKTEDHPKKAGTVTMLRENLAAPQKVPGPRVDDRLFDLFDKDIDKAVEKPVEKPQERRRLEFSKAVSNHPKVRYFINYFSKRGRTYFEKILARSGKYMPMIAQVLSEEGLPEELAYLALIESAFLTNSISSQGAAGLWQFVPSTARLYGLRINSWVDERRDPEKSTRAAAAYLKELHNYFGRWYLATAAYNAGPGAIDKAMQQSGARDFWTLSQKAQLSDETRQFVPKFVAVAIIATNLEKYSFNNLQYDSPLEFEEVEVRRSLRLGALAEMAEAEVSTIRELNPSLLGNSTPPGPESFIVKVPIGKSLLFAKAYEASKERTPYSGRSITHEVKKGETLFSIARRYGQEVGALMHLNGLTTAHLQIGQKLKVLMDSLSGRLK